MRRICVITGSRAEYSILHDVLRFLQEDIAVTLQLVITGTHLSARHGQTVCEIEADGFPVTARVDMGLAGDTPVEITRAMGRGLAGFADIFAELLPAMVVLTGDRYEMLVAAQAAMMARIPIAHIHGGEASEGQIDEAIRHAMTKMAHYHFVAADAYRKRVIQLGEKPEHIFTVGAAGLDSVVRKEGVSADTVLKSLGLEGDGPLFLVTYHPVTLSESGSAGVQALLAALENFPGARILFTGVNADMAGTRVSEAITAFVEARTGQAAYVVSLGRRRYVPVLHAADLVIGNSSSGLIEAPAAGTPTVNIGPRQQGRLRARSVLDAEENADAISRAIETGLSPSFHKRVDPAEAPYGTGGASQKIAMYLGKLPLEGLLMKKFHDLEVYP